MTENKSSVTWEELYDFMHKRFAPTVEKIATSVHKCEFLFRYDDLRYCYLDWEREVFDRGLPISEKTAQDFAASCYNEFRCPYFEDAARKNREADEVELERICREEKIEYIPPDAQNISSLTEMHEHHASILGRNYPLGYFEDRGGIKKMPYTVRYGVKLPIICSASVVIQKQPVATKFYVFVREAKEGSGDKRKDYGKYDLPGGAVEQGESFEECAMREFYEETGMTVQIDRLLGVFERISLNLRLILKAVFISSEIGPPVVKRCEDTSSFCFINLAVIRAFYKHNRLKSPDIMLIMNMVDQQMIGQNQTSGPDCVIRLGLD